jgi:hypothetical protein
MSNLQDARTIRINPLPRLPRRADGGILGAGATMPAPQRLGAVHSLLPLDRDVEDLLLFKALDKAAAVGIDSRVAVPHPFEII